MAMATSTAPSGSSVTGPLLLARGDDPAEPPVGLRQGSRKTGSVFPGTKYRYSSNTP
jgi:hypothetical protein